MGTRSVVMDVFDIHKETATSRALSSATVLRAIAEHVPPHEMKALGHTNRDFFYTVHTPPMWRRQYEPARLNWETRSIETFLRPPPSSSDFSIYKSVRRPEDLTRILGKCSSGEWHLNYVTPRLAVSSPRLRRILDNVSDIGIHRDFFRSTIYYESEVQDTVTRERAFALAFLMHWSYRYENSLSLMYYNDEAKFLMTLGLIGALLYDNVMVVERHFGSAVITFGVITYWLNNLINSHTFSPDLRRVFSRSTLRSIAFGPLDRYRLNMWAKKLSEEWGSIKG